jgi:hypothetical protein
MRLNLNDHGSDRTQFLVVDHITHTEIKGYRRHKTPFLYNRETKEVIRKCGRDEWMTLREDVKADHGIAMLWTLVELKEKTK